MGLCAAVLLVWSPVLPAYSVLTHEAIIDSAWDTNLKPLLLQRFPAMSADELRDAHAYAYAGCILQDLGYYPFGSKFFSNLVHYVRSGDFVANLVRESQNPTEYAFALGALAHYAADAQGHSIAVNPSVAIQYPKLRRKYGSAVTYEDNPTAHIRVEFGFDVLEVAHGNYAPQAYHDFIGFKVARPVLERAFKATYSLDLSDVFSDLDLALGTYRRTVSTIIPEMTRVAWQLDKGELVKARPGLRRREFVYNLSRASYRREWDRKYRAPGIGARILAFLIRILPKIGPLKAFQFKPPPPRTETLFEASFNKTLEEYRALLGRVDAKQFELANRDFDTGKPTRPTEYRMADDAYAMLAIKLSGREPSSVDPRVREDVLAYFRDRELPFATKRNKKEWRQTLAALEKIGSQNGRGSQAGLAH